MLYQDQCSLVRSETALNCTDKLPRRLPWHQHYLLEPVPSHNRLNLLGILQKMNGYPLSYSPNAKPPLRISTPKLTEYIQKSHYKHILGCTFLKIPITLTQSMFLLCKLFSTAVHSMHYFYHVMRLYADEWNIFVS